MFVATITIGLVIAAEQPDVPSDSYATVINGVIFTLTSCLFYSLNYVVVEYFLSKSSGESTSLPPPTGKQELVHHRLSQAAWFFVFLFLNFCEMYLSFP
mmetsp:Transcript_13950/g.56143  ORF Transcript_13950/g.56143 Transcript_13950/m.56143 type:complete len:99 (+) Transcript_13950:990-1286(+)